MQARDSHKELWVVIGFTIIQLFFWYGITWQGKDDAETSLWKGTKTIKPDLGIVPPVPSDNVVKLLSAGDDQFYYRAAGFRIQNAGDTFGRVTALRDYDYSALAKWWNILDRLDPVSDYIVSLVAYYYSASQNPKEHMPYVVDYLESHADKDPGAKWWWYNQAIYIARNKLKDEDRGLKIAYKMANIPEDVEVPIWVRQMPAFVHEKKGEYKEACEIILNILDTKDDLKEGEINFIYHFINERISAMAKVDEAGNVGGIDPRCYRLIDMKKQMQGAGAS